jgi:hypothetical protein
MQRAHVGIEFGRSMLDIDGRASSPAYAFALIDLPPAFDYYSRIRLDLMVSYESYRDHSAGADSCIRVCAFCIERTWESPHRTISIVRYMVACRIIAASRSSGKLSRLLQSAPNAREPECRQIEVPDNPAAYE